MPESVPALLERGQAAERLHVSVRTVRRWGKAGRLEDVRLTSHTVLVTEASVDKLIRAGKDQQ